MERITPEMRKKMLDMIITALISAGIAFLQSLLAGATGQEMLQSSPAMAGAVAVALRGARIT